MSVCVVCGCRFNQPLVLIGTVEGTILDFNGDFSKLKSSYVVHEQHWKFAKTYVKLGSSMKRAASGGT